MSKEERERKPRAAKGPAPKRQEGGRTAPKGEAQAGFKGKSATSAKTTTSAKSATSAKPKPKPRPKSKPQAKPAADTPAGERVAKVLARAGVASRRDVERMIEEGRVSVNGERLASPARNVTPKDILMVDGKVVGEAEQARLWLYHKPRGLVTTAKDEKGRETIYDHLPPDLPRVMPVGRLDITSEGLLLLTNDGGLKRRLELPETGWIRKYRVRVNGRPTEESLKPLADGLTVDGVRYQPMLYSLDRQQGANAWLTVGIREGKNREIRRAMEAVGLIVNRLIRTSYGPFLLGSLKEGAVEEVRARMLNDALGLGLETPAAKERRERTSRSEGNRSGRESPRADRDR